MVEFSKNSLYEEALDKFNLDSKTCWKIKKILNHFKPKFDIFWKKMRYLEEAKKELQKSMMAESIADYIKKMEKFYGAGFTENAVYFELTWAPVDNFTATVYGNHVIFSIPFNFLEEKSEIPFYYSVAIHELGHTLVALAEENRRRKKPPSEHGERSCPDACSAVILKNPLSGLF